MNTADSELNAYIEKIESENDVLRENLNQKLIEIKKLEEKTKKKRTNSNSKKEDILEEKLLMVTAKSNLYKTALIVIAAITITAPIFFYIFK